MHGYRLALAACERMLAPCSAALPLDERREVPGLHPDRAPTIVAGAAILVESMRAFGLDDVEVSEADILHGAALDARPTGEQRTRLAGLDNRYVSVPYPPSAVGYIGSALGRDRVRRNPSALDPVHRFGRSRIVSAPPAVRTARPFQGTYPCPS